MFKGTKPYQPPPRISRNGTWLWYNITTHRRIQGGRSGRGPPLLAAKKREKGRGQLEGEKERKEEKREEKKRKDEEKVKKRKEEQKRRKKGKRKRKTARTI